MAFRLTPRLCSLKSFAYKWSGWNRYGLHLDDLLDETDEDVLEALRRLPPHVRDERNFRIISAIQLDVQKKVLPKEQWMKMEDDCRYLSPIVEQVKKERLEREKWDDTH